MTNKNQAAQKAAQTAPKTYTPYQGQYFAHALTLDGQAEDTISRSIASAKVDMNPHQVEAALFALRSPLSQGVILADEVGLGKTIEASLVIAQKWAERQRKILLIVPAMLRNQWAQELSDKFSLPSMIIETSSYNLAKKAGKLNPFESDRVVICSYEFAARKDVDVKSIDWHLVIFDEAHKLRNVWKKDGAKKAKALQAALDGKKKMLLSATPLQNSLLELYGLISIIDPHFFGSADAFKAQYVGGKATAQNLDILKHRLGKVCSRTLRRQVQQEGGIKFTRRHSIVEDFRPSQEELDLYDSISSYLQRDDIASIKPGARHLVTLVIRKILASSSFAISGTLEKMIQRLESGLTDINTDTLDDIENIKDIAEELDFEEDDDGEKPDNQALRLEIEELKSYQVLAKRIQQNEKGNALLKVLDRAFTRVTELGGARKAVIFTESCRTQQHLKELLETNGYAGEIVLLNGSNNDPESKRIYQEWQARHKGSDKVSGSKSADMKAAIVEEFKNKSTILISTESGAEGVNMQFCSLLVNYDLPWNPQRVEQRIGRVHRYGQQCDVVVVNFLNKGNKADQLVFELLDRKFKLFEGVFGASDEILGAIESGVDIEQRINGILQKCRHTTEIEQNFAQLQLDLDGLIEAREQDARRTLLENFDPEVLRKLQSRRSSMDLALNAYEERLMTLIRAELPDAEFEDASFKHNGEEYFLKWKEAEEQNGQFFRIDHGLAGQLVEGAKAKTLPPSTVRFNLDRYGMQLGDLKEFRGKSGWLALSKLTVESINTVEHLVAAAKTDDGQVFDGDLCARLMLVPSEVVESPQGDAPADLPAIADQMVQTHLRQAHDENGIYFEEERDKLERWAEDTKQAMEQEIKALEKEIREAKKLARSLATLDEKTKEQRRIKKMEKDRDDKMLEFFNTRKQVDEKMEELLDTIEAKLQLNPLLTSVFMIRWELV
jgi:superfamily II DNA or RNA helicase